jgi:predicted nucleotidyltransferase
MAGDYPSTRMETIPYCDERADDLLRAIRQPWREPSSGARLDRICGKYGIQLLALFGSHVKGGNRGDSDVDVAFLADEGRRTNPLNLYGDLVPVLGTDRLDLVNLRSAGPLLRWNVAREGVCIWSREPDVWLRLMIKASHEWNDNRRYQKYRAWAVKRFLAERGL